MFTLYALVTVAALVVASAILRPTLPRERDDAPRSHDDYVKHRDRLIDAYVASINEYDRLVTWASGGALALSITFIDKIGAHADRQTAPWLAAAWIFLCAAFSSSLGSQYASSRLHSWRRAYVDHQQGPLVSRGPNWDAMADRLHRRGSIYGRATRALTFASGLLLLGGIICLARFAFLNIPFRP